MIVGVSPRSPAILLLMLVACDDGSGPVPVERLTAEMAGALCQQMGRCCTDMDRARLPPAFVAVLQSKDCAQDATLFEFLDDEFNLARLRESVLRGRSRYDPADGRRCIDHLKGLACPDWTGVMNGQAAALGPVCVGMVKGTRPDGHPCEGNLAHECTSGTCRFAAGAFTCGPAPAEGESCEGQCEDVFDCSNRCAAPLLCSPDNSCTTNPPPRPTTACLGR
jgi:hypothetical protein